MIPEALQRTAQQPFGDMFVEAADDDRVATDSFSNYFPWNNFSVHAISGKEPASHGFNGVHRHRVEAEHVIVVLLAAVKIGSTSFDQP